MLDRVARCHLIASILSADGIVKDNERDFLRRAMKTLELTADEKQQVIDFEGAEAALETAKNLPEDERRELLDELVQAALADGKLSPLELGAVKRLSAGLGFEEG